MSEDVEVTVLFRQRDFIDHAIGNLTKATQNAVALIEKALKLDSLQCDDDCDCRKSLELAVWTAPETIDAKSKSALAPLFK